MNLQIELGITVTRPLIGVPAPSSCVERNWPYSGRRKASSSRSPPRSSYAVPWRSSWRCLQQSEGFRPSSGFRRVVRDRRRCRWSRRRRWRSCCRVECRCTSERGGAFFFVPDAGPKGYTIKAHESILPAHQNDPTRNTYQTRHAKYGIAIQYRKE